MNIRTVGMLGVLVLVVLLMGDQLRQIHDDISILPPIDYMQYWSAGRAILAGQNPYSGDVLLPLQQQMRPSCDSPVMMWNPPWTLPLTMLLAQFPWRLGQLLWLAANLAAVAVSAVLLWRLYTGEWKRAGLAVGVALAFAPTPFLLMLGQISGFLLLGLVGFLWAVKSERWALAGAFAALTAVKPHLLVPFALVLVLQSLRGNAVGKSVLAGGVVLLVFGLIPLAWDSAVWSQYLAGTAASSTEKQPSVRDWEHPTLGYMIRDALPARPFAAMFLPLGVALPLVAVYWWVRRENWDWGTELPRLVLVSLVAAPYGAWVFDLVLLLVPVIQATTWIANDPRRLVWMLAGGMYLVLNLLAFGSMENAGWTANPWIVPLTVAGYIAAMFLSSHGVYTRGLGGSIPRG